MAQGNSDKWCSVGASKWLRVDLGASYTVSQITLRHAGAGGESTAWNTRDFNLQTSTDGSSWTTVATVSGNTASATTHSFAARSARYVRLTVTTPSSDGNGAARIYELEVYGQGQFNTNAYYRVMNRNSGKALAVRNAGLGDTEPLVQWVYADATTNDEWRLVEAGGGYYALVNRHSGKPADVNGAVTTDGATLIQFVSRGSDNQQWQLIATDSGYQRVMSRLSGKAMDVKDALTTDGAQIIQWPWGGGANQQWQLVQVALIGGTTSPPPPTNTTGPAPTATRTNTAVTGATATRTRTNTTTSGNPAWAPNTAYAVGVRVSYAGLNYQCLQGHTSLVGWEPPNAPSLWQRI